MANAKIDSNFIRTKIAVLNTDYQTIKLLTADPTCNRLMVSNGTTGIYTGTENALRDDNNTPVLMAVSSVDKKTRITLACDTNGKLLIQST